MARSRKPPGLGKDKRKIIQSKRRIILAKAKSRVTHILYSGTVTSSNQTCTSHPREGHRAHLRGPWSGRLRPPALTHSVTDSRQPLRPDTNKSLRANSDTSSPVAKTTKLALSAPCGREHWLRRVFTSRLQEGRGLSPVPSQWGN